MTCPAIQVLDKLEQILQQITTANGYQTDLGGSVHRGFYAQVLHQQDISLPCVCIEITDENISGNPAAHRKNAQQYRLVIAAKSHLPDLLYQAAYETRKALYPHTRSAQALDGLARRVEAKTVQYVTEADSGYTLAVVTLDIDVIETY